MTVGDYAVADAPELEGLTCRSWPCQQIKRAQWLMRRDPWLMKSFETSLIVTYWPSPRTHPQVVFCNAEVNTLDDLKGKKVRASGRMTAKFLEALGAEGVNVSFSERAGCPAKGCGGLCRDRCWIGLFGRLVGSVHPLDGHPTRWPGIPWLRLLTSISGIACLPINKS